MTIPASAVRATMRVENATLREEAKFAVSISDAAGTPTKPKVDAQATALIAEAAGGWRYSASATGDDWKKPDFDDKGWKEVKAPLGNGEPEVATRKGTELPEKGQAIYARRAFDVPAGLLKEKGVAFRLRVASDNSAAVYLNGKAADEDSGDHEFSYWNRDVEIPAALLKPGRNVIAVRVENAAGSSDLYLDLTVVEYLKTPPSREKLAQLYRDAGIAPREGVRTFKTDAEERGLTQADDDTVLAAMVADPRLIERPLVETEKGARLCRPPEKVEEIL